jgi:CubicO group peptidase (beta-lactamase class C family)
MTKRSTFLLLAAVQICALCGARAESNASLLDSLMSTYCRYGQFSGSVLVASGGEVVFNRGYGLANRELEVANTARTSFRIASLTKQFTSMLVMQAVERGVLKLDARVSRYIPEYPAAQGERITIHQLLSHTSGMPHYEAIPGFFPKYSRQPFAPEEFIKLFWNLELIAEPGTRYSYSSFGYYLLGVILERVTGKPYGQLLREGIFEPAGMAETRLDDHLTIVPGRASGYRYTFDGFENASFRDMSTAFSTGALISTVEDLYRWDQALYSDLLLSDKYSKLLFSPNLDGYAYGWSVARLPRGRSPDSLTVIRHWGDTNGFTARIERIPEDSSLIVLLRNSRNTPMANLEDIAGEIRSILYSNTYAPPKRSLAETLYKTIMGVGAEQAASQYRELFETRRDEYNFAPDELDGLGYDLLWKGRTELAISVFKLNAAAWPNSFEVFNSLGDALLASGNRTEAAVSYRQSLRLNPDEPVTSEKLRILENTP